ncbi:MAG: extracellular solute-binding protein [Bacillota bacterium]
MRHLTVKFLIFLTVLACFTLAINAQTPKSEPFGDPRAVRGGQLNLHTSEFPKSFNAFTTNTADATAVFNLVYDTLMELHPTTIKYQPLIAKSWEISADKKTFTFKIDPRAKWADGKGVTADDVKFSYDVIMNPKNMTSVLRLYFSRFNEPVVLDKYTIKFTAKTVHFKNLEMLSGLNILPKHLFAGKDFNKAFNMSLPAGSGPYVLSEVKEGRYFVLTRRKDYWADQLPHHRGMYNFNKIKYKVMDENVAFEAFKKGEYDIYDEITAKRWVTESNSEKFRKNWIIKQKIYNYAPKSFAGLAINMRLPVFQDLRVRQALFYLLDRRTLIEKLMYNQYKPLNSYWPSLYGSQETANPLVDYNPAKAKELLKEAGYTRLDKEGYLINQNGERLEFTISYAGESWEKNLTLYVETCKQAGVKVNLELLSWATLIKRQEEFKFDMVLAGWTGVLFDDPEQLWHSKHAAEVGSSNLSGYKNPAVDKLIDSLPPIFDPARRNQIIKQIDHLVYKDIPYILLWDSNYTRIFYKNVFGMPKTVFSKYSTGDVISYWWFDPSKQNRYKQAVSKNKPLPAEPVEVFYDKAVNQK